MKEYELELSQDSIMKGIEILKQTKLKLARVKSKLLNAYADFAIQQMKMYVPIDTGELASSFKKSQVLKDVIEVYTNKEYAAFVEFGTGIVGAKSPRSYNANIEWQYDVNQHGESGWWYYIGNEKHWTKGQVASEYMYKALQDLDASYQLIAQKVFEEEGLV